MDPDFVFIVTYSCPRCHAALEAQSIGSPSWLRCPACGRASLPPEHNRTRNVTFLDDETLVIGSFTTGGTSPATRPRMMDPLPVPLRQQGPTPTARVLLGTGFFLSTILFLFSLLDSSRGRAGFFGLIAIVCLTLLARQPDRPTRA